MPSRISGSVALGDPADDGQDAVGAIREVPGAGDEHLVAGIEQLDHRVAPAGAVDLIAQDNQPMLGWRLKSSDAVDAPGRRGRDRAHDDLHRCDLRFLDARWRSDGAAHDDRQEGAAPVDKDPPL